MQSVSQRIAARCALEPLTRDETGGFIRHRLDVAQPDRQCRFSEDALDSVYALTTGVPRLICLLCDRTLREAGAVQSTEIRPEIVAAASIPLAAVARRPHRADDLTATDDFTRQLNDWLAHLERAVDRTPTAPIDRAAPRPIRQWTKPHVPLIKRLFP